MDSLKETLSTLNKEYNLPKNKIEYDNTITLKIEEVLIGEGYNVEPLHLVTFDTIMNISTLTSQAIEIINEMKINSELFLDGELSQIYFESLMNDLEIRAFHLNDLEKIPIGVSVSVCKHSSFYWKSNLANFGIEDPIKMKMTQNQKAVAWADATGALKGAMTGAAGGVAGAIIGGMGQATCNSIATAILIGPLNNRFGWIADLF